MVGTQSILISFSTLRQKSENMARIYVAISLLLAHFSFYLLFWLNFGFIPNGSSKSNGDFKLWTLFKEDHSLELLELTNVQKDRLEFLNTSRLFYMRQAFLLETIQREIIGALFESLGKNLKLYFILMGVCSNTNALS